MPTTSRTDSPRAPRTARHSEGRESTSAVYPVREDTLLLLPFAAVDAGTSFLEVGAGAGTLALAAARRGARVTATDLNPHAVRRLAAIARREGLDLVAVRTDLARGLGRFDRIVANPPYLPTQPDERDPDRWHNLALDGGEDGWSMAARLIASLADHLLPGARAYVLTSTLQSEARRRELWRTWRARSGTVRRVASRTLEGERLEVYEFRIGRADSVRPIGRRTSAPRPGSDGRPRTRSVPRSE
jgi:release factor glutamine methyltransferase